MGIDARDLRAAVSFGPGEKIDDGLLRLSVHGCVVMAGLSRPSTSYAGVGCPAYSWA